MALKKTQLPIIAALLFGIFGYGVGYWVQQHQKTENRKYLRTLIADIVDKTAPNIELNDLNQNPWNLSDQTGKIVIINFWATWCSPCLQEIPELIQIKEEYDTSILEIVGITQEDQAKVEEFADKMQINYTLLLDDSMEDNLGLKFGNSGGVIPYTIFIDQENKVQFAHAGALTYDDAVDYIEELIVQ